MKISENTYGLENLGLIDLKNIHRNLPVEDLVNDIVNNGEGVIGLRGAAMVDTGIYTGRSPKDKYIVDESSSNTKIWWGPVNRKISEDIYNKLYKDIEINKINFGYKSKGLFYQFISEYRYLNPYTYLLIKNRFLERLKSIIIFFKIKD